MGTVVIILGAPGAGKGTQATRLSRALSLPHISTGDLFRENLSQGTPLGERAREFMESGKLVPDELVIDMLFDRVSRDDCQDGYLLDGFPRTTAQAESLTARIPADWTVMALNIDVADSILVERISGRLLCKSCGNIQHESFSPPKTAGVCDSCGGELHRRKDDDPAVVAERLRVYHSETAPVVEYYRSLGTLHEVDGEQTPDAVFADLRSRIGAEA